MKSLPLYAISLLVATLLIAVIPTDAEAKIYEDTIRLHILANSDTKEDQALKLEIRDRILEKYGVMLSASKSVEQAKNEMEELFQQLSEAGKLNEKQKERYESMIHSLRIRMKNFTHKDQKPYWT